MLDFVRSVRRLSSAPSMSALMARWFCPCPCTPRCPKHNPRLCVEDEMPRIPTDEKCILVKMPCTRNHGRDCSCHVCRACRELDGCGCSMEELHGKCCDCEFCMAPHDYGCECRECRAATAFTLKPAKRAPCKPDITRVDKKCEDEEFKRCVLALGEDCYVLLCHPRDCLCKCCEACKKRLQKDRENEELLAGKRRRYMELLGEQEEAHGADCKCLKCCALRLRVEVSMCHAHLGLCRCHEVLGTRCTCRTCADCRRRLRKYSLPKAEDLW